MVFSPWVKGTRQLLMAAETIPQCVVEQISKTQVKWGSMKSAFTINTE